ncbi:hypothetical protein [Nocardia sp. XZ_19_369]|uniref:hypothetical protein n=1 Tax=Nocardia sp. XZ_19_369 TaxID=2769487 RepID=UPI0027D2A21A|nr:hypothetical protein [Nocardia sp. XZ_19_369]
MPTSHSAALADRSAQVRHRRRIGSVARLHRPLTWMVLVMTALTVTSLVGLLVDDRMLLGESVWLKPLKFGFAFALYGLTLAWLLSLPHKGSRATWWLGTTFAVAGVLDVGFIAVQAARGTFSHFNNFDTDPVNEIGQRIFMSGVPGLFLANLVIVVILSWQRLVDRPTARAIHFGLALAVAGMAMGYLMGYTGKQLVRDTDGKVVELIAGHTVIDPASRDLSPRDAAPGMPITNWSTIGGDLRVPHFVGLHGIQILLLTVIVLAWLAPRYPWLRAERTRAAVVGVLALGYTGLLAIVFTQAMRAQPLIHPDATTLASFAGLSAGVALLLGAVYWRARTNTHPDADDPAAGTMPLPLTPPLATHTPRARI